MTKRDHVFVGTPAGKVFRGSHDPEAPGQLRFEPSPELHGPGRVHAFAEFEGRLYASIGVDPDEPGGGLYRRRPGDRADWELVYAWQLPVPQAKPGLRGLTSIPHPSTPDTRVLIGAREHPGVVEMIEPHRDHRVTVEYDVRGHYLAQWGQLGGSASIIAYNEFTELRHPDSGELLHWAGLYINAPSDLAPLDEASHFLVRHVDGTYEHGIITKPGDSNSSARELRGARTLAPSPFPEDEGRVFYIGGFDAHGSGHRSTGWIYRAELPSCRG